MRRPSRAALFRLWLSERSIIVILAAITLVLALGFGVCFLPLGPPEQLTGTVLQMRMGAQKNALDRVALVGVGAETVVVSVPPLACRTGDSILLDRRRRLWGYSIVAEPMGCAPIKPGAGRQAAAHALAEPGA